MSSIHKECGIYRFVNLINGKSYVGKSNDLHSRYVSHLNFLRHGVEPCTILNNAWKKYGEENFAYEVVCVCCEEELDDKEREYIEFYDSYRNGYNCTRGGGGVLGYRHTDEAKKKIGDAFRGKPLSKEQCERMSIAQKGKKLTDEHKQALRDAWTDERRQKQSRTRSGLNHPNHGRCGKDACNKKPVISSTGEYFSTLRQAASWCGVKSTGNIVTSCKGTKLCGRHPVTGEQLRWRYATTEEIELYNNTQHS